MRVVAMQVTIWQPAKGIENWSQADGLTWISPGKISRLLRIGQQPK